MRSSLISRECTGVSGGRCKGGGMETPELPGPLLREGKVETGLVPTARRPGPGSSADTSKGSSTGSPSPRAPLLPPACPVGQRPPTPPSQRRASLAWSSAPGSLPPASGSGHQAGAPRCSWRDGHPVHSQPSLPGTSPVSSGRGCPTTTGGSHWVCSDGAQASSADPVAAPGGRGAAPPRGDWRGAGQGGL